MNSDSNKAFGLALGLLSLILVFLWGVSSGAKVPGSHCEKFGKMKYNDVIYICVATQPSEDKENVYNN